MDSTPTLAPAPSELPGMPERSPLEQTALQFVNLRKQLSAVQEQLEQKGAELLLLLKAHPDKCIALQDGDGAPYVLSIKSSVERITCQKGGKGEAVPNPTK